MAVAAVAGAGRIGIVAANGVLYSRQRHSFFPLLCGNELPWMVGGLGWQSLINQ